MPQIIVIARDGFADFLQLVPVISPHYRLFDRGLGDVGGLERFGINLVHQVGECLVFFTFLIMSFWIGHLASSNLVTRSVYKVNPASQINSRFKEAHLSSCQTTGG